MTRPVYPKNFGSALVRVSLKHPTSLYGGTGRTVELVVYVSKTANITFIFDLFRFLIQFFYAFYLNILMPLLYIL